jgi:hypothetical protein
MKVFLTGDRSMAPELGVVYAAGAVAQMMAEAALSGEPLELSTGDNDGFEAGVRAALGTINAPVHVVATGVDSETSKPAWDTRHEVVDSFADKVVIFHSSPLESSIAKSAMKVLGDKVILAGHES